MVNYSLFMFLVYYVYMNTNEGNKNSEDKESVGGRGRNCILECLKTREIFITEVTICTQ